MTVFDFQKQLAKGKAGEALFLKAYPDLKQLDGRHGDFIGKTGRIIELKTDSRTCTETVNFFMEVERDDKKSPGGPWQAQENGVYYFCYLFADGFCYWLEVTALVEHLEEHATKYQKRRVQNKGWSGMGYLVPRASVEHLIVLKENILERLNGA